MHGGSRAGAGRKTKIQTAIKDALAECVVRKLGGEEKAWQELFKEAKKRSARLLFEILKYRTDQLYGRARKRTQLSGGAARPVQAIIETKK